MGVLGVFGFALFPNRAKLFCCVGDDGGGGGLAIQGQGEKQRREWKEGKDMRKEEKKADCLSHASKSKALWETNKTSVEWTLCGKPRIPFKDEGHCVRLLKLNITQSVKSFQRQRPLSSRLFVHTQLPPEFSRNTQRTDGKQYRTLKEQFTHLLVQPGLIVASCFEIT